MRYFKVLLCFLTVCFLMSGSVSINAAELESAQGDVIAGASIEERIDTRLTPAQRRAAQVRIWDIINKHVDPEYFVGSTYDCTESEWAELTQATQEITKDCTTQYEKIKAITIWISDYVYYDWVYIRGDGSTYVRPYDVFKEQRAVCAGYARLVNAMCNTIGIPSMILSGDNHDYNAVYDSEAKRWIFVDTTWCSENAYSGPNGWDYKGYTLDYFDLTPEEIGGYTSHEVYLIDGLLNENEDVYYELRFPMDPNTWYELNGYVYIGTPKDGVKEITAAPYYEGFEVVALGYDVFMGNTTIEKVDLSKTNISFLTEEAFLNCTALETVLLPDTMELIEGYAFSGCTNLKEVAFSKELTTIGAGAFFDCDSLEKIDLSDTQVASVGPSAFKDTASLKEVLLPNTLETLGHNAFLDCVSLTAVDLSNTLLKTIEFYLFSGCKKLEQVLLPDTVETVKESVFLDCASLKEIDMSATKISALPKNIFNGCVSLQKVEVPDTLETIGEYAFYGCEALKALNLAQSKVKSIDDRAFYRVYNLEEIYFPTSLESIGLYGFYECKALKSLDFSGTGLNEIGNCAFYNCAALKTVDLSSIPLQEVGYGVFESCTALESVDMTDSGITSIGENAFSMNLKLQNVSFPASLEAIGRCAFRQCEMLEEIDLSHTKVANIAEAGFGVCTSVEEVMFPETLKSIGPSAFGGCKELLEIDLSNTKVTTIEDYAFQSCESAKILKLPDTLEEMKYASFDGCESLKEIDLSNTKLKKVSEWAFANCSKVEKIEFPCDLEEIGGSAFTSLVALKELDLSNTKVNLISDGAFYGASNLRFIQLPNTVSSIAIRAFNLDYVGWKVDTIVQTALTANDIGYTGSDYIWEGRNVIIADDYYTVVFDGNDATYGEMDDRLYGVDVVHKLPDEEYEKDGYEFNGWNTYADGSGKKYEAGESVKNLTSVSRGTVTLYAQWKKIEDNPVVPDNPEIPEDPVIPENPVIPVPAKPYKIANVVSGVHVYWTMPAEGASKYGLWRSENGVNGTYKWIANPTVPHFTDTKVESGKTYYYKVTVCDDSTGEQIHGEKSEAIGVVYTSTPDITSRINKAAGIQLGWEKIPGATGYGIYRKTYSGNDAWVRIATIDSGDTLSYTDASVKAKNGSIYKYTIRALAGKDNKTLSGCRNTGRTMVRLASRILNNATKTSATSIKCNWTTSSSVTGYEVRFMTDGKVYKTYTIGNYKTGTKTFTGLQTGKTYKIQVRAYKKVTGVGSFYSAWSTARNVVLN